MDQITKKCFICGLEKEIKEFYVNRKLKDGLCTWCIRCTQLKRNKRPIVDKNNKICSKCKIEKPLHLFTKDKNCSKGHSCYCKECQGIMSTSECRKESRRRYKKTEKGKETNRKSKIRNKAGSLLYAAQRRAKEKGLEFELTKSDIIIPEICPVLGIPIINGALEGQNENSPSIDRIDNSKGYVKGNICVISKRANTIKNNGSLEEHKKIVEYIEKHLSKMQSLPNQPP